MNSNVETYFIRQKLKDDNFNIDDLQYYALALQLGATDFQIAVIDSRDNRCLILEDYVFPQANSVIPFLQDIFEDHHFLKAGFWSSVKVAFKNKKFSLIPGTLFEKEYLKEYLDINTGKGAPSLYYYKHDVLKAVNVFGVDPAIVAFFTESYPGTTLHFLHQTSALIEGVKRSGDLSYQPNMSLFIEEEVITIIVNQEQNLLYCNRFSYASPVKMMDYIMAVMHELGLDQYTTKAVTWGYIGANSPAFEILQKYIYNISFGGKLPPLTYGYVFDELEDHNYFDLFSIYLCE